MKMEDITYMMMRTYAIKNLLRFDNSMTKIRNGELNFKIYSKELVINWTMLRVNTNHKDAWKDDNTYDIDDIREKANKLDNWIMINYKNPEYMREYHKEYYHNVRKFKNGSQGYIGRVYGNRAIAEKKTAENMREIKIALGACKKYDWKPTIKKLMELTKFSKPTVIKYKKILMPKPPKE